MAYKYMLSLILAHLPSLTPHSSFLLMLAPSFHLVLIKGHP